MAAGTSIITERSPYIVRTSFTLPQSSVLDRRLGGQERHQEGRHASSPTTARASTPRSRSRSASRQAGGQVVEAIRVPLAQPRLRAVPAARRRRQARCALRVRAVGPGRHVHEAVRRARPRQGRHQADRHRRRDRRRPAQRHGRRGARRRHLAPSTRPLTTRRRTRLSSRPSRRPTTACARTSWRSAAMTACT